MVLVPAVCTVFFPLALPSAASPIQVLKRDSPSLELTESRDQGRALGMVETLQTILREEGPRGLYRGILPSFLKVIPAVSIGYVMYERIKAILNVETVR